MSNSHSSNPVTRGVAEFISNLRYEQMPQEVRERTKRLMLDAIGCGLFGADLQWSKILQQRLSELDTTRSCAVWGTSQKLSAPHAALVNGTQVQGFELDDTHLLGILHCGSVVLPPLVSIAEGRPGMSGREFLTAAVAGYEVGPRVGICMGNEHIAQGWHSGATAGVFAAAASAARGLKLDTDKTVHALGIATAAFKDMVTYINDRKQSGRKIIEFQGNQFMLADLATDLAMAESWLDYVAGLFEHGESDFGLEASMIKMRASDLAMRISTEAVQMHGGYGYCADYRVERLMRDAKITQIWEGTNQVHRQLIGRSFIKK